jgi:hypothetical protein
MESEILIAGIMVAFSVAALLGIILMVARAVGVEPTTKVKAPETAPVLRPVSGW